MKKLRNHARHIYVEMEAVLLETRVAGQPSVQSAQIKFPSKKF